MKTKDHKWYKDKIRKLKKDKKQIQKDMASNPFSSPKDRKKVADDAKREKRAFKRAEKQNWQKEVEKALENDDI